MATQLYRSVGTAIEALDSAKTMSGVMRAFWLCSNAEDAKAFIEHYSQKRLGAYAERNIRDGLSMEGGILESIGLYWLDGKKPLLKLEDHGQFYCVLGAWDCECEENYIQRAEEPCCPLCQCVREDRPPSRLIELIEGFGLSYEDCDFQITRRLKSADVREVCERYKAVVIANSGPQFPGVVNEEDGA